MKKTTRLLGSLLAFVLMFIGGTATNATATDPGINPHFGTAQWWNYDIGTLYTHYQYTNYPVPCNNEPTGAAWEVIWAYKAGTSSSIPQVARDAVSRASSIFPASAKQRVSTWAQVRNNSYAPRWETSGTGDGNCGIQFNAVSIPANIWPNDAWDGGPYWSKGTNGIYTYIKYTLGANEPNRKYLVLRSNDSESHFEYTAVSDEINDNSPGQNNLNNGTGIAYIPKGAWELGGGGDIAHEMAHNMGALVVGMPHHNPSNVWHASDCGDIMCYPNTGLGQTWNNGCGTYSQMNNYTGIWGLRLDCNGDDYFNPNATWDTTRWAVHNSAFLWNPPGSQPLNFPTSTAGQISTP